MLSKVCIGEGGKGVNGTNNGLSDSLWLEGGETIRWRGSGF